MPIGSSRLREGLDEKDSAVRIRSAEETDLKKPSLVFVRSTQTNAALRPFVQESEEETLALPAGTRLLARLQAPVSSSVATPVVAVVEYNYERDGQIVMPAGAKMLGRLTQASPSGDVAIQFSRVDMPDGTSLKLDASAMDLNFKPLKGYVSGIRAAHHTDEADHRRGRALDARVELSLYGRATENLRFFCGAP
jgi:type IV secretory pathway VirB10-like protein